VAMQIKLNLEVVPAINNRQDGYHARSLFMEIEIPFAPVCGLIISPPGDSFLTISQVVWNIKDSIYECCVEDSMSIPLTEAGVDKLASAYIKEGWKDEMGSSPLP